MTLVREKRYDGLVRSIWVEGRKRGLSEDQVHALAARISKGKTNSTAQLHRGASKQFIREDSGQLRIPLPETATQMDVSLSAGWAMVGSVVLKSPQSYSLPQT